MNGNKVQQEIAGLLGIILVLGAIITGIIDATHHQVFDIPNWEISLITLIVGYYFGKKTNGGQ